MMPQMLDNTNAVFHSNNFERDWHPEGGDSHPPPGRDFALALGDAFIEAGLIVAQMDRSCEDAKSLWWEHSYWYFFLSEAKHRYFVQVEPIDNGNLWRIGFSVRRGLLGSIFGDHRKSLKISFSLQQTAQTIIEHLAHCDDLRWVTEDEAVAMW